MEGDFRVGDWLIQPQLRIVQGGGKSMHVEPKAMHVLVYLAEHAGQVVPKERLIRAVWADTFVTDDVLTRCISELRKAFDDDAHESRVIQTIPKGGYRLIAPVQGKTPTQPVAMPTRASWRRVALVGGIGVVLLTVLVLGLSLRGRRQGLVGRANPAPIRSLAVLPLENLSRDPEQEYFADGMTEALITDLSKIGALRVISRTSVMQYKGAKKPLPQIARELNVDGVIEGSVQRSGDRVRITAKLIHAPTDTHLWAESYERDLRDVLALQDDVARAIASQIRIKLTPQEQVRLASARPVNPEAHEAYLKGRYFWNKRTEEGLKKSLEYFQKAIDVDPNYALGYAGLADSYGILGNNGHLPPRETHPKAKAAALKALELNDNVAEAHSTLAAVMEEYDFDWAGAEKQHKRAIELNPNCATAHHYYAWHLAHRERVEESITEIKRAQELDPLSLIINMNVGRMLYYGRRYDEAIEQYRKTLEMDPNLPWAHYLLGVAYEQKGMHGESIAELQKAVSPSEINTIRLAALARAYALDGRRSKALKILHQLKELSKRRYVQPVFVALIYEALGDKDRAFLWLEKAYQDRSVNVPALRTDARFDSLRSDPRFQDLLRRIGLPP